MRKSFEIQDVITSFSWNNCRDNTKIIFSLVILQLFHLVLCCYRILPVVYLQSWTRVHLVGTLKLDQVFPIHHNQCWKMSRFFFQQRKNHLIINIARHSWREGRTYLVSQLLCPGLKIWGVSRSSPKVFATENRVRKIRLSLHSRSILLIARMITDCIALHSVFY